MSQDFEYACSLRLRQRLFLYNLSGKLYPVSMYIALVRGSSIVLTFEFKEVTIACLLNSAWIKNSRGKRKNKGNSLKFCFSVNRGLVELLGPHGLSTSINWDKSKVDTEGLSNFEGRIRLRPPVEERKTIDLLVRVPSFVVASAEGKVFSLDYQSSARPCGDEPAVAIVSPPPKAVEAKLKPPTTIVAPLAFVEPESPIDAAPAASEPNFSLSDLQDFVDAEEELAFLLGGSKKKNRTQKGRKAA